MASRFKNSYDTLKETCIEFSDDHATKHSASLAYFTIFSIGPLLLVLITLLGFIYRTKKAYVTNEVFEQLGNVIGPSGAKELQVILENISHQNHSTLFGVVGGVVLVFGATGIFTEMQSSINWMWSIKAKPKRGWLKFIIDRLLSFVIVLGMGLLLFVALLVNVVVDILYRHLPSFSSHFNAILLKGTNIAVLFVLVTLIFWIIFKVLPDATIHWKDAMVGAIFTGVLFLIGKFVISYYLGMARSISAYGAAASIILLLSWIYYSSLIVYFGAEFTEVYARKWGKGITVTDSAVFIIKREEKELPNLKHPVQSN
jgi:membrane protein